MQVHHASERILFARFDNCYYLMLIFWHLNYNEFLALLAKVLAHFAVKFFYHKPIFFSQNWSFLFCLRCNNW
jgi:hypothetical protein